MLVNYRLEYRHTWGNHACYSQVRLDPLGGQSADEMLHALLGEDTSLQSLKNLIIEKAQGNPFFIEEIVQTLLEQGVLVHNGSTMLTRPLSEIRVPPTVQGILAARVDALPAPEKSLLQTLAVIGKDFSLNLVSQISAIADDRLEPMLKGLQTGEFIYEQSASGETEYTFKHVLTQEVAYNSVLMERRRHLHERTGQMIEMLFKDRIDDHVAELARHYSRSTNTRKAVEYLFRAGSQAAKRYAHSDAIAQLSSALELLKRLTDDNERSRLELQVQSALAVSLVSAKGWAAVELEPVYARTRELCAQVDDPARGFAAVFGEWLMRYWRLEMHNALKLADELLVAAEGAKYPAMLFTGHNARGITLVHMGQFVSANEHLEKALAVFDLKKPLSADLEARRLGSYHYLFTGLFAIGYPDRAWAKSREMIEVAQRSPEPYVLALANCCLSEHSMARGDNTAAQKYAEEAMARSEKLGRATESAMGATWRGASLIAQGRYEEGIDGMRRGLSAWRASGGAPVHLLCHFAAGLGKNGRSDEGLQVLEEGFTYLAKNGAETYGPLLYHFKGDLLLARSASDVAEAEHSFRTAIEIARRQGARSPELRATTSLARLLAKEGRRDEARAMLAEIYNWFTEGFDTADLKNAKALLDDLSA
jgi:predicted ATPase